MNRLPSITPKKLLRVLRKNGFFTHHQVGSHLVLKNPKNPNKRVTLPMHNKDLKPKTLLSILKQAGLDKQILIKN